MKPDLYKLIYTDDIASLIIGWVKVGMMHELIHKKVLQDRAELAFDVMLERVLPDSKGDRKKRKGKRYNMTNEEITKWLIDLEKVTPGPWESLCRVDGVGYTQWVI